MDTAERERSSGSIGEVKTITLPRTVDTQASSAGPRRDRTAPHPPKTRARPRSMPVTGLILAGGRSQRMGTTKALLPLGERTVLDALYEQLRTWCAAVYVVTGHRRQEEFAAYPVILDEADDQGPLMGLCSGLAASATDTNLVVACDIPFIDSNLVDFMLSCSAHQDIAFASLPNRGGDQPLLGVYKRTVLPAIRRLLAAKRMRIAALFPICRTVRILVADDDWYANLNSPDDYQQYLERVGRSPQDGRGNAAGRR
jgi:molybdopterin-guanine dinucleotide biosynthesis protein A